MMKLKNYIKDRITCQTESHTLFESRFLSALFSSYKHIPKIILKKQNRFLFEYKNLYKQNDNNGLFYILNGIVIMEKIQLKEKSFLKRE